MLAVQVLQGKENHVAFGLDDLCIQMPEGADGFSDILHILYLRDILFPNNASF